VLPYKAQNRKPTFPDLLLPQETSNLTYPSKKKKPATSRRSTTPTTHTKLEQIHASHRKQIEKGLRSSKREENREGRRKKI
jgi:hypothetical protein